MKELFVPYQESLELKELEFDEDCIATYEEGDFDFNYDGDLVKNSECPLEFCTAPLFSQIFKWFRNKHNLDSFCRAFEISGKTYWKISKLYDDGNIKGYSGFKDNYEKAELGCIRELIEILKSKKNENNI